MPISSNTLIHFTNSKEKLKSIFLENFRLGYCKEKHVIGDEETSAHVPMVSFCDIPLSQIKDHVSKYGNYGIGLTREWGIRNKLNPVLYVEKSSLFSQSFRMAANFFLTKAQQDMETVIRDEDYFNAVNALGEMLSYVKNYQANLTRKNDTVLEYRFADEREWRFVPPSQGGITQIMSDEAFASDAGKAKAKYLIDTYRLEFEPNDIKYVIIRDESEIREFIEHLRYAKQKKYSSEDIDRLTTRILTTEQIKQDF